MTSITDLQVQIAQRLADQLPIFTQREGWEVLTEIKGDIESLMNIALQKIGIGLCVFTPASARGDLIDRRDVKVIVSIVENTLNNQSDTGTRISGVDLAWCVDGILHLFQPLRGWSQLLFEGTESVASPFAGTNSWDVTFQTSAIVGMTDQNFDET